MVHHRSLIASAIYAHNKEVRSMKVDVLDLDKLDPSFFEADKDIQEENDEDELELENLLKDRLFVSNVTVDKKGHNILRLKVEERVKNFILHSKQQYVWVDHQGVVTQQLSTDEKSHVQALLLGQRSPDNSEPPIIKRNLDDEASSGFQVFSGNEAKKWISLVEQLRALNVSYREFEPPGVSSTIMKVLSKEGYELLMDITVPLDIQLETYNAFLKAKPKDVDQVEYIDVRVPGRVYLKEI